MAKLLKKLKLGRITKLISERNRHIAEAPTTPVPSLDSYVQNQLKNQLHPKVQHLVVAVAGGRRAVLQQVVGIAPGDVDVAAEGFHRVHLGLGEGGGHDAADGLVAQGEGGGAVRQLQAHGGAHDRRGIGDGGGAGGDRAAGAGGKELI